VERLRDRHAPVFDAPYGHAGAEGRRSSRCSRRVPPPSPRGAAARTCGCRGSRPTGSPRAPTPSPRACAATRVRTARRPRCCRRSACRRTRARRRRRAPRRRRPSRRRSAPRDRGARSSRSRAPHRRTRRPRRHQYDAHALGRERARERAADAARRARHDRDLARQVLHDARSLGMPQR
jgi:hypothetical protein